MSRTVSYRFGLSALRGESRPPSLVVAGRFCRSAIMAEAVRIARKVRAGSWAWRMSCGLRQAWAEARRELAAAGARLAIVASCTRRRDAHARPLTGRTAFMRGSRVHSHGW